MEIENIYKEKRLPIYDDGLKEAIMAAMEEYAIVKLKSLTEKHQQEREAWEKRLDWQIKQCMQKDETLIAQQQEIEELHEEFNEYSGNHKTQIKSLIEQHEKEVKALEDKLWRITKTAKDRGITTGEIIEIYNELNP